MSCEQEVDNSQIDFYTRSKKSFLKNPKDFVEEVIHDAVVLEKTGVASASPNFWVKVFTEARITAMNGMELGMLIGGVERLLETDEGKRYDSDKCQMLLNCMKTVVEAKKSPVLEAMVPDL